MWNSGVDYQQENGWYRPKPAAGGGYTGPGDINGAAAFWAGLRGFSAAYSTGSNPCCDLVDQAGANLLTGVVIKADGTLDVASINAWVTAHSVTTIKCTKLYDQSGNGLHLVQATLANMPTLNLTGLLGAKPTLVFNGSTSMLTSAGTVTSGSTFTMADLASRATGTAFTTSMGTSNNTGLWFNSTSQIAYYAGSPVNLTTSAPNGTFHRFQVFFNGAASTAFLNNALDASNPGAPGAGGINGSTMNFGGPFQFNGSVSEGGAWSGDKSANYSAMDANIKTFWGL